MKAWMYWDKMRLALFCSLFSLIFYIYLSFTYYQLKFSSSYQKAFCSFSKLFDCGAVSASSYASFFDIPLSLFGVVLHLALLILFFSFYYFADSKDSRRTLSWFAFCLSSFLFLSSLVMASISFFLLKTYCVFCFILYGLSFLQWEALRRLQSFSKKDIKKYFKEISRFVLSQKGALTLIALFVSSFLIHKALLHSLGFKDSKTVIRAYIREWKMNPFISLDVAPSLAKGPEREKAEMFVSEFADFLCVHCRNASLKLDAFSKAHPRVRVEFYNFPLDGSCNKDIGYKSGLSCRLSKAIHCVSNHFDGDKAWRLHDDVFLNQDLLKKKNLSELDQFLKSRFQELKLSWEKGLQCIESESTQSAIQAQIDLAKRASIEGTPFILVNGKRLSSAEWLPNLETIRGLVLSSRK